MDEAKTQNIHNHGLIQGQNNASQQYITQNFYSAPAQEISAQTTLIPLSDHIWNVPYSRNPYFTGREDLLVLLHEQLSRGQATALSQAQAISGLGGIGKTQLAVEYAHKYRDRYRFVFWVLADTQETLIASYIEIASLLNLPQKGEQDQSVIVQVVKTWLHNNRSWLLILDNADEPALLKSFLPTVLNGHLLLTTRASSLGSLAYCLEVDSFTNEQGILFLLRRAGLLSVKEPLDLVNLQDRELALQITQELGALPLALDQAGAYIDQTQISLNDYLHIYQYHRIDLLRERRSLLDDHPEPVATTWSISFERVEQRNSDAANLLRLCAFLAPDDIPEEIIEGGAKHLKSTLQAVAVDAYLLNNAIEVLLAYSLIKRDRKIKALSVHRLVQTVIRDTMSPEERKQWIERIVETLDETFPDVKDVENWNICARWLPHALLCSHWIDQEKLDSVVAANLLNNIGYYLDNHGRYREAEPLYRKALEFREKQLGPEHPDTATSLHNLAFLYQSQGRYEEAEPLHKRALDIRVTQLGEKHPDTVESLNNLAWLYGSQRKYKQANLLAERALAISEKQLGPQHPDTATSIGNLAMLYQSQGRYEEAEPLHKRALDIRVTQLGERHPDTASSLNNLALFYESQKNYEKAESLYRQALSIHEEQLGSVHPDVATNLGNLANLYLGWGKLKEAKPLYERAIEIYRFRLDPQHPDVQTTLMDYALCLSLLNEQSTGVTTRSPREKLRGKQKKKARQRQKRSRPEM